MTTQVICSGCGAVLGVEAAAQFVQVRCPQCKTLVVVPPTVSAPVETAFTPAPLPELPSRQPPPDPQPRWQQPSTGPGFAAGLLLVVSALLGVGALAAALLPLQYLPVGYGLAGGAAFFGLCCILLCLA